jgi:hypothetical protein
MKWIALLTLALLAALALWWLDPSHQAEREARTAREVALVAQETALTMERRAALAPWLTGFQIAGVVCLAALAGGATAATLRWLWWRSAATLPTQDGRIPLPVILLAREAPRALGASHAARQLAVSRQELTHALTLTELLEVTLDE